MKSGFPKLLVFLSLALLLFICFAGCQNSQNLQKINLSGEWKVALDSTDTGITGKWFSKKLDDVIHLPGSLTSNGIGNDISLNTPWIGQIVDSSFFRDTGFAKYRETGNFKVPFWLQPVKYYKGTAWFQKKVDIPKEWKGKDIVLFMERCHWESRVWFDNHETGKQNSLGTPHVYDLSQWATPGKHTLTICIDNRVKDFDPGINSHSISDHTQTNWNGIIGQIFLEARPITRIQSIQLFPDILNEAVKVKIRVKSSITGKINIGLKVTGPSSPKSTNTEFVVQPGENLISVTYAMGGDVKTWNEFHPDLYLMKAILTDPTGIKDSVNTTFGMREITVSGKQLLINGNPAFLRGTLECSIFPKTGFPPTDKNEWLRIFNICRAYGLNHMRFHSWCPPDAAFVAADETGFYLQVECSSWANQSTTLGDGKPIDKYLYDESERMVEAYGNHPSFCMMAYGNEPGGDHYQLFLTEFVNYWKHKDKRRIYVSAAGWPNLDVNDYLNTPDPRIQRWGEEMHSIINAEAPRNDYDWETRIAMFSQPVISHEIGQWCVYPDFSEMEKYDGVVKAKNFEIFRESLKESGMSNLADSFLLASGKLQALCYKAEIEAALRSKGLSGFQLLDLHDFPGQGTALVGVLNPFWQEKGYITAAEYSRFCNSTVPLARMKKFIFRNSELLDADIEVAHYGESPLIGSAARWKIRDTQGKTIKEGTFPPVDILPGIGTKLGKISVGLDFVRTAQKLIVEMAIGNFVNSWDIWVYPSLDESLGIADNIRVVHRPDAATLKFLQDGGTVLLTLKQGTLSPEMGGSIKTGFSSIFWNTAWTGGQGPHTLGILVNPLHPALEEFPTEYYSNWQWWDAMKHGQAMNLAKINADIKPVVRVIDDWFTNRPLALIFEAKMGKGKIMVSSIDLITDLNKRPEAQQLLFSLKKYLSGTRFDPVTEVSPEKLEALVKPD